ncbi:T6SS immunity protein Tdi1 domain-containing protein [Asticcacaulis machinosus]|uniref:DUF1851 domain-containing protein n=1 Tax=Asticcacaulis machinosus TaxID=2984211 RepID=A0ABT5HMB6_9CAUL|nr:T6SS immunity protein Tdi1 domain-containing protein [Asticcacaulis machinosus]MDC7677372.1 DUF1851 domain-containing protein [Asticcacaulis machinosus]
MVNIHDYLIDQSGKDWAVLLADWVPPLPSDFTVWMVNRFGDVFATFDDGSIHMLDIGGGSATQLATNREDFITQIGNDETADNWLLMSLTNACVASGMTLKNNECYSFKIPPLLGGLYEVDNIEPTDLSVHYSFLADIYIQTKDLPEGSKVNFKFIG